MRALRTSSPAPKLSALESSKNSTTKPLLSGAVPGALPLPPAIALPGEGRAREGPRKLGNTDIFDHMSGHPGLELAMLFCYSPTV